MSGQPHHQVVVTGLGPVTSIGTGVDEFWNSVVEGRSGVRTTEFDWERRQMFHSRVGAPVPDPAPETCDLTEREARLIDPAVRLVLAGTALALRDAGLDVRPHPTRRDTFRVEGVDPGRVGVILGTGIGGLCTIERTHTRYLLGEPMSGPTRYAIPMLIPNAMPAQVAIRYGLRGECKTVVTACASGTMATGDAFRLIRDGELDMVVTGGADKTLSTLQGYGMVGFDLLKTLSTRNDEPERASRPFDADRDGFVLGEGAGVLVLEREEHARSRGARPYARVAGYGTSCDAHSMVQLEPSGDEMVRCMERAIRSSGLAREDITYANAHGTSTLQNDAHEAGALRRVFGGHIGNVLVNSTKAMIGHGIGAAGGVEAITTALTLARGIVHRCVNLDNPDPACDVELPRENRAVGRTGAISNSFGFGGHNSTLVLTTA
jgi:3-oxoacyl-[acyl-carrier-protein] synthase II